MQVSEPLRRKAGPTTWPRGGRRPRLVLDRDHVPGDNGYKLVTFGESDKIGMKDKGIQVSH